MINSCQEIFQCFPSAPSGYYQIHAPNGSLVQVYCDMEGTNCGGQGGWTRVAYVNMSQSGTTYPQGLTEGTFSGLTLCGRSTTGCQGTWVSYVRSQLLTSMWPATWIPVGYTRCFHCARRHRCFLC